MLIGYLRIRTDHEDTLAAQRQALADAGCTQVAEDLISGRRALQPELRRVLDGLRPDDVIVVPRMDNLGRSLPEVVRRTQSIIAARAGLRSLKEEIDTTTEAGRVAAQLIGGLAKLDRGAVRDGINAGLAAARARGRQGGRRPKLTEQQRVLIADEVLSGRSSAAHMAREHKVSEATVSRVVAASQARADASADDYGAVGATHRDGRVVGVLPFTCSATARMAGPRHERMAGRTGRKAGVARL